MSPDVRQALQHSMRSIENGMPRAIQQLALSEQELASIQARTDLSQTERNRAIREAKASVATNKKTLHDAQATLLRLKTLLQGE